MIINYVIITAAQNEERYIEQTIVSVINQTILPRKWIIINDGSSDGTRRIIEKYLARYSWIEVINLENRGFRAGKGPAEAFNIGFRNLNVEFDFIVNLDADLAFDENYFSMIFERFRSNPNLGIASGKMYQLENGKFVMYRSTNMSTIGASKVYRKKCFLDLGGVLKEHMCWDMLDEIEARMKGWETRSFSDISFKHLKIMGSKQKNLFKRYFIHGRLLYTVGYHPIYTFLKSIYRGAEFPYLVKTIAILAGYVYAFLKRDSKICDDKLIFFLRKEQLHELKLRLFSIR